MNKLLGLIAITGCIFIVSPQAQAQVQQGDGGVLQLRSMQTRKFINVDLKKLTNAIESVVQIQGFNSGLCSMNVAVADTMHYCYAYTNTLNRIDFLLQSNVKDKTSILRVSYTKQFQEPPPQEAKDFYSKFFKSMGDILFVDSQKLDMQEIN